MKFSLYIVTCVICLQVIIMLLVVLLVFTAYWLPLQISILYSEHRSPTPTKVDVNAQSLHARS